VDGIGRPVLLKAAHDICAQLSGGNVDKHALIALASADVSAIPAMSRQQAALIGGALGVYCAEYTNQLN
jgi:hypothetical protein